ncbi:uncharacterized protein LOC132599315 isoform X2 [Lycium barbarum]|uniref:uncharacterized protein LOC132599315 isoform X2 n=1 Tax=Lycium barbarum TaxID=112863 RepID=UPI00293E2790|nr:uncharacterized protein LOC132599315 isoform X2 [Lycium barbarum]
MLIGMLSLCLLISIYLMSLIHGKSGNQQDLFQDITVRLNMKSCSAAVANSGCIHTKKDGRVICSSLPIYGKGKEPGNEAGYIVGMSTCYPRPGSVKISKGETLTLLSNYSSDQRHTGVMGLFYILVAEPLPKPSSILHSRDNLGDIVILHNAWAVAVFGIAALVAAIVTYQRQSEREEEYESIL